jgi:hypothetical protein
LDFYDATVSGADPINERPGFKAMLDRIAANGVRTILVESLDRFARDLTVQLTGHDFLKSLGVDLIPTTAPDFFTEDTPTAVLVRQVLGAIAQFEKTSLVAKLKAARERSGNLGGRKVICRSAPRDGCAGEAANGQRVSLRKISAALADQGHLTSRGRPYVASTAGACMSCPAEQQADLLATGPAHVLLRGDQTKDSAQFALIQILSVSFQHW